MPDTKADYAAAKARAKALRPWYRKKRFVLPLGLVVIIVLASLASGGNDDDGPGAAKAAKGTSAHPAIDDVIIDECVADPNPIFPSLKAKGRILNNSSKTSNYIFTIEMVNDTGTRIGETAGISNNVASGQTVNIEVVAQSTGPQTGLRWCRVTDVTRLASS